MKAQLFVDMDETLLHSVEAVPDKLFVLKSQLQRLEAQDTLEMRPLLRSRLQQQIKSLEGAVPLEGGRWALLRPGASDFLSALSRLGDVRVLSLGSHPYVQDCMQASGLGEHVLSAYSSRENPCFNVPVGCPWLLVDDMDFESFGVLLKMFQIAGFSKGREAHLIRVKAFRGVPDTELLSVFEHVKRRLRVLRG